ncbi:AbiU2 domain-containing protein [Litoribacter populi]|uniref:AbiU2 domain-containing protein n=1 Tax=Litoribacter populi TaxID=2598460 RepID=UPI002938D46B|nr:hypothetical protein [Litoribacter populi]
MHLKNVQYCLMALHLSYKSLNEISSILSHDKKFKTSIAESPTFRFYNYSLHYMLVMEICKLMEPNNSKGPAKYRDNHYASLKRLIGEVELSVPPSFKAISENLTNRIELLKCGLFSKILHLRDKKLAYSDMDQYGGPLSFKGFDIDEIEECRELLDELQDILKECISHFDYDIVIHSNTQTQNLLKYVDEYKAFAKDNKWDFFKWQSKK